MQEQRICIICKKPYIATLPQSLCCSTECSKIRRRHTKREYMKEYSKSVNSEKKPRKKKHGMSDLARINAEARAAGMTYGLYVGVMGL